MRGESVRGSQLECKTLCCSSSEYFAHVHQLENWELKPISKRSIFATALSQSKQSSYQTKNYFASSPSPLACKILVQVFAICNHFFWVNRAPPLIPKNCFWAAITCSKLKKTIEIQIPHTCLHIMLKKSLKMYNRTYCFP